MTYEYMFNQTASNFKFKADAMAEFGLTAYVYLSNLEHRHEYHCTLLCFPTLFCALGGVVVIPIL